VNISAPLQRYERLAGRGAKTAKEAANTRFRLQQKAENGFDGFDASRPFWEYSKMPGKRSQEWPQSRVSIASVV
jgi:hypothetical protein